MSDRLWQRLGAGCGIVYVVLLITAGSIVGSGDAAIARASADAAASAATAIGFSLEVFSFLFFLFFLGSLWSALRRAEGENGWLSMVAFASGLMSVTIKLASASSVFAALYRVREGLDPQIVRALLDMNDAAFSISFFPLVVLLVASGIVIIRSGALPRWLGWLAGLLAIALMGGGLVGVIYHSEDAGLPFLLFWLWIVMTSIVLMRRAGQPVPPVSGAFVTPPSAVS